MAVGAALANPAVASMNIEIAPFAPSDFPSAVDGLLLSVENATGARRTLAPHAPALATRHHMLTTLGHVRTAP